MNRYFTKIKKKKMPKEKILRLISDEGKANENNEIALYNH